MASVAAISQKEDTLPKAFLYSNHVEKTFLNKNWALQALL